MARTTPTQILKQLIYVHNLPSKGQGFPSLKAILRIAPSKAKVLVKDDPHDSCLPALSRHTPADEHSPSFTTGPQRLILKLPTSLFTCDNLIKRHCKHGDVTAGLYLTIYLTYCVTVRCECIQLSQVKHSLTSFIKIRAVWGYSSVSYLGAHNICGPFKNVSTFWCYFHHLQNPLQEQKIR